MSLIDQLQLKRLVSRMNNAVYFFLRNVFNKMLIFEVRE